MIDIPKPSQSTFETLARAQAFLAAQPVVDEHLSIHCGDSLDIQVPQLPEPHDEYCDCWVYVIVIPPGVK